MSKIFSYVRKTNDLTNVGQDIDFNRVTPIKTGFTDVDKFANGGLRRGAFMLLNSLPAMGKTSLGAQMCYNVAKATNNKTLFISSEMIASDIICKIIAQEMNCKQQTVERILNEDPEFIQEITNEFGVERIDKFIANITNLRDEILNLQNLTISDTDSEWFQEFFNDPIEAFEKLKCYDFIVVDFLQNLFEGDSEDIDSSAIPFMQKLQRKFKGSNTAVLFLAQKHEFKNKAKNCPDVWKYVDVETNIVSKENYTKTTELVNFVPTKNRFGGLQKFQMGFVKHSTVFAPINPGKEYFERIEKYAI